MCGAPAAGGARMNPDPNRLHHLFGAHSDGTITPEEHAELENRLRNDPEARRQWFLHQDVDDGLHGIPQAGAAAPARNPWRSRRLHWQPLAAAAAVLVMALWFINRPAGEEAPRLQSHEPVA